MGSLYSEHLTWLHQRSAGLKLAFMALLGTVLFTLQRPVWLSAAAAGCLLLWISLGPATRAARRLIISVWVGALLVAGFHTWAGQPAIGLASALRLVSASTLGVALTVTTRPADMLDVFDRLLRPLAWVGLHPERVALQLALMLRFVEHFFVQWKKLDEAYRLRTGKRGGLRLLAPLTVQMLLTARRVGDAIYARLGF